MNITFKSALVCREYSFPFIILMGDWLQVLSVTTVDKEITFSFRKLGDCLSLFSVVVTVFETG